MKEKTVLQTEVSSPDNLLHALGTEILRILAELSRDRGDQLTAELMAEGISGSELFMALLPGDSGDLPSETTRSIHITPGNTITLENLMDILLSHFSELIPPKLKHRLIEFRSRLNHIDRAQDTTELLESVIKAITTYADFIVSQNNDLKEFIHQTIQQLGNTEAYLINELTLQHKRFNAERKFEKNISGRMEEIKYEFIRSDDVQDLRKAVLHKIESINMRIEKKRELDTIRLREAEDSLQELNDRIKKIKHDADEIKKHARAIEEETLVDGLTGLYNRKAYEQKVSESLATMRRLAIPYSLLFCDIDHFRTINDMFGKKVGDETLKKLSALIREKLRLNDFVSRYGEEEFAIILTDAALEDARRVASDIMNYIANSVFSHNGKRIPLTISMGVSTFRNIDTSDGPLNRARAALDLAKRSGKNSLQTEEDCMQAEGNDSGKP